MRGLVTWALLVASPLAFGGDTMRCGDRIVSTEALIAEVLAACGPPDHRDRWQIPPLYVVDEEQWYYNFGARRLVRVLRFRHGRLASIDTDGYGFDGPPASRCGPADLQRGLSTYALLRRCGPPLTRESFTELRELRRGDPARHDHAVRPIRRERWVYDFGADTRQRIVELRDGRITDIEQGGFGGAPKY
jgi:hypothetical protein